MQVVAERGLTGTTLRHVADAAGVSVGLVQRYFVSKDDLLHFGFAHVYQRTHERVAAVPLVPPVKQILLGIAEAILPLDEERCRESRVWLAFVHASLTDPRLAESHRQSAGELLDGLRQALDGAQRTGELDVSVDTEVESLRLMALLDGLTVNRLAMGQRYADPVLRALLHQHVDGLFEKTPR